MTFYSLPEFKKVSIEVEVGERDSLGSLAYLGAGFVLLDRGGGLRLIRLSGQKQDYSVPDALNIANVVGDGTSLWLAIRRPTRQFPAPPDYQPPPKPKSTGILTGQKAVPGVYRLDLESGKATPLWTGSEPDRVYLDPERHRLLVHAKDALHILNTAGSEQRTGPSVGTTGRLRKHLLHRRGGPATGSQPKQLKAGTSSISRATAHCSFSRIVQKLRNSLDRAGRRSFSETPISCLSTWNPGLVRRRFEKGLDPEKTAITEDGKMVAFGVPGAP